MTTNDDRVERLTYPTAAFTIRKSHVAWIARAAKRAGLSKSAFVRQVLDRAMSEETERAA